MDLNTFRTVMPDFSDTIRWPDAQVQFWLDFAGSAMDAVRWGSWYDYGQALYAAHNLSLSQQEARTGGAGTVTAPTSSKAAGPLSVSYDINAVIIPGAGSWNMTTYGIRWVTLERMVGAGGVQLGGSSYPGTYEGEFSILGI